MEFRSNPALEVINTKIYGLLITNIYYPPLYHNKLNKYKSTRTKHKRMLSLYQTIAQRFEPMSLD